MNYEEYFEELISGFLAGSFDKEYVSSKLSADIGIDEIKGDETSLLTNCEWALRHINEKDYYTTESELKYYLSCLKGEQAFSLKTRDMAMDK